MPSPFRSGRVAGDGLTLAYREWRPDAPGEPIVLLHGITGSSAGWLRVAEALPGRRVIAFDARGHGGSDWSADEAYGGDQHFADLHRALDALEIERCTVAGYSMGGGVGIIAAAAMHDRISRLVVIDTYPHPQMSTGSRRIAGWVSGYAGRGAWFDPAIARQFNAMLESGSDARLDLWPLWEAIECPVLLVRGEHSDVLTGTYAEEMLARQPGAALHTVPGVAHPIPFARPTELAEAMTDFAASLHRKAGVVAVG